MKIKVYNIAKLVEGMYPDKKVHMLEKLAIVSRKHRYVIFNDEAIGWKKDNVEDTIEIGLTDIPEPNHIFIMAHYSLCISIDELLKADFEEIDITEFVPRWENHHRISSNFKEVMQAINEIK